jgi:hypothetical protein
VVTELLAVKIVPDVAVGPLVGKGHVIHGVKELQKMARVLSGPTAWKASRYTPPNSSSCVRSSVTPPPGRRARKIGGGYPNPCNRHRKGRRWGLC